MKGSNWDQSLLEDYFAEVDELLDALESGLIRASDASGIPLADLCRSLHTIKGLAATFGFQRLADVAHAAEDVLKSAQNAGRRLSSEDRALLLRTVDHIRRQQQDLQEGREPAADAHLLNLLAVASSTFDERIRRKASQPDSESPATVAAQPSEASQTASDEEAPHACSASQHDGDGGAAGTSGSAKLDHADAAAELLRVPARKVDSLIEAVGLASIYLDALTAGGSSSDTAFDATSSDLSKRSHLVHSIERALSAAAGAATSLRAVPIRNVFRKLERAAWETARMSGKSIRLHLEDNQVEIDHAVLNQISDAMLHLVRNAVDHGIESPDQRTSLGKAKEGTITLRCRSTAEMIVLEIIDDGKGLDLGRIRDKAVQAGLLSALEADAMTEADLRELIFQPGFSTAGQVTQISGRGVGMDIVKRAVVAVGGTVSVESRRGRGCTFTLRLPKGQVAYQARLADMVITRSDSAWLGVPAERVERIVQTRTLGTAALGSARICHDDAAGFVSHVSLTRAVGLLSEDSADYALLARTSCGVVALDLPSRPARCKVLPYPADAWPARPPGISGAAVLPAGDICLLVDLDELVQKLTLESSVSAPLPDVHHACP